MQLVLYQLLNHPDATPSLACDRHKHGWAPLHILANGKDPHGLRAGMISLLVKHGADVEAKRGDAQMTPLMVACSTGHLDAAHALMVCGADPQKANRDGATCWDLARMNSMAMVKVLEDVGGSRGKGATGLARFIEGKCLLTRRKARQQHEEIDR